MTTSTSTTSLNFSNLSVDKATGRVSFSGLGTGIDTQAAVDAIIQAKRIPATSLETKITDNKTKITALQDLRATLNALKSAIANMRGAVSFDASQDIFAAKQASATTTRTDGNSPTAAANLIGVAVTNAAAAGSQTLEVRRIATAQKIASATFASKTAALGISGDFTISNGTTPTTISVLATDTLTDIRDRINNANSGTNATKVTASIVSISSTQQVLMLTNDTLGTNLNITDAGSVLSSLGLSSDHGATFTTVAQRAETARLTSNGLTDPKHYESARIGDANAALSSVVSGASFPGSFTINGTGSAVINYTSTTTLSDLASAINLQTGTTGVTATVSQDGNGYRLDLDSASAISLTDTNGLLGSLGVNDAKIIERSTNTIDDLFTGMTISLFGAETGTSITLDVAQDLSAVKSNVQTLVTAYNAARHLLNEHSLTNSDGTKSDKAGALFGMSIISNLRSQLANIAGASATGTNAGMSGLAMIGVTLVNNSTVQDQLDKNTLTLDETKLDKALISSADDIRRLFAFDLTSSDPDISLIGFSGKTTYSASGYTLNIGTLGNYHKDSVSVTSKSATLNNASSFAATTSGSFTVNGQTVTYDISTDTLESLTTKINQALTAASVNVQAIVSTAANGNPVLSLNSTNTTVTVGGDTGDLLSKMNIAPNTEKLDSANIGGAANGVSDGTVTVSGRTLTVTHASGAEDLKLLYMGAGSESGITLNFTVGLAAKLDDVMIKFADATNGAIQNEIDNFTKQDDTAQTRIDSMDQRLAILRQSLTARFTAMETAVTNMRNILAAITQQYFPSTTSQTGG